MFDRLMGEIRGFTQQHHESLDDAWIRTKDLLRSCHGHGLGRGTIIQIFYHRLDEQNQTILDAGGIFLYKMPNEAHQLLEDRVLLNLDWSKENKTKPLRKTIAFVEGEENSPLLEKMEALTTRMTNYGKFLKDLVSNKSKMEQISAAFLTEECSAILQNKIPPKLGDLESFLIPYKLANSVEYLALANLGASINLIPYSLYAALYGITLKPTRMSIRLANHTYQYPMGVAENMLVQVGKFVFLVDFVIQQMEEDDRVSLILGRPFLHTAVAIIRDELDALLDDSKPFLNTSKKISETPLDKDFNEFMSENVQEDEIKDDFEELPPEDEIRIKKSIQDPPTDLKMKPLPKHLEYAFLEENSLLPVVISALLKQNEKEQLISVLKNHKESFAWKTSNIPGIIPS
ncbi:reverse transcriptase domain-containing protein, partial [Tanacetum coccineum]